MAFLGLNKGFGCLYGCRDLLLAALATTISHCLPKNEKLQ